MLTKSSGRCEMHVKQNMKLCVHQNNVCASFPHTDHPQLFITNKHSYNHEHCSHAVCNIL